jgi:hypothetical protein
MHVVAQDGSERFFVRDAKAETSKWVDRIAERHQAFAWMHDCSAVGFSFSVAVWQYTLARAGCCIFWEIVSLQAMLQGCVGRRWIKQRWRSWQQSLELLSSTVGGAVLKGHLGLRRTASFRGEQVGDAAFAAATSESLCDTYACVVILAQTSVGHYKRDKDEAARSLKALWSLIDSFVGHGTVMLKYGADEFLEVAHGFVDMPQAVLLLGKRQAQACLRKTRSACSSSDVAAPHLSTIFAALMPSHASVARGETARARGRLLDGVLSSFVMHVELTRDLPCWRATPLRELPTLRGKKRCRRVSPALKLEVMDLAQACGLKSVRDALKSRRIWGKRKGDSTEPHVSGRTWEWGVQFQYVASTRSAFRAGGSMAIATDGVRVGGEDTLFTIAKCRGINFAAWLPPAVRGETERVFVSVGAISQAPHKGCSSKHAR